jgi:hypothetical protein
VDDKVVRNSDAGTGDARLFFALHHDPAVVIAQVHVPADTNGPPRSLRSSIENKPLGP